MTDPLSVTDRTRLRRMHDRGAFDRTTINAILDAQPMCFVGYVIEGRPYVTPTFQWREGDHVYWHGSSASRAIRQSRGQEACLTVSILDGFVLARSGMHHSANTRSVMLFGRAEPVPDDQKEVRLNAFIDGLWPGRSDILRPATAQEMKATALLSMKISEGSAKIRTGGPHDDEEDYALPIWAGVIPVARTVGVPEPDPRNLPGVDIPPHVAGFRWSGHDN